MHVTPVGHGWSLYVTWDRSGKPLPYLRNRALRRVELADIARWPRVCASFLYEIDAFIASHQPLMRRPDNAIEVLLSKGTYIAADVLRAFVVMRGSDADQQHERDNGPVAA